MSSPSPADYLFRPAISNPFPVPGPRSRFSALELKHIAIAFLVLTLDMVILLLRPTLGLPIDRSLILQTLIAAPLATATGFLAHEMGHKFSAQSRGLWSEFRMSPQGLLLGLVLSAMLGVLFATPGATMVGGRGDPREAGITSLAGPATNLVEVGVFYGLTLAVLRELPVGPADFWGGILLFVFFINAIYAAFNLLPMGPLDGKKVLAWNRELWVGVFALALALGIYASLTLYGYLPLYG